MLGSVLDCTRGNCKFRGEYMSRLPRRFAARTECDLTGTNTSIDLLSDFDHVTAQRYMDRFSSMIHVNMYTKAMPTQQTKYGSLHTHVMH